MERWEYQALEVVYILTEHTEKWKTDRGLFDTLTSALDAEGDHSWELVNVVEYTHRNRSHQTRRTPEGAPTDIVMFIYHAFFKRRKA